MPISLSGLLDDDDEFSELVSPNTPRADLVKAPANGADSWLVMKQDAAGLLDPEFVQELAARSGQGEKERAVMANGITVSGSPADIASFIHKAAQRDRERDASKEAGVPDTVTKADVNPDLDDGRDGLDPTVPLAEPDEMGSGSPTDPGSPAWESVDAATACKWTSILARARVAVDMLAERELLEAAAGDDGDACNAMDLQDACCAIDYVIGVLAPFAVAEQSEADCGDMAMAKSAAVLSAPDGTILTAIRKGAEDERLPGALATLETYGAIVRKSGRVLSSVNEQRIRTATASLTEVLSSLPLPVPDDGTSVAKMTPETEADMPKPSTSEDATAASGQEPALGAAEQPPAAQEAIITKAGDAPETPVAKSAPALQVGLFDHAGRLVCLAEPSAIHTDLTAIPVAKADGDKAPMMVVYNQAGDLVGIVSPDDITPVANSTADPDDAPAPEADPAGTPAADDMTPAPAAETGTPAATVPDDGTVAKQDGTITVTQDVLKSIISEAVTVALGAQAPAQDIAKGDVAGLREKVEALVADIEVLKEQPAMPKVFTNGQVPPAHQLRGQDQGAGRTVDVAKAAELKHTLYKGTAPEQKAAFDEMQQMAVDGLAALYGR